MAYTRRDYINQALRILDAPTGSNVGRVTAFDGNPPNDAYTNDQSLTDFLNDAGAELATTCLPLYDTGTKASFTTGMLNYTDLTVSSGNRIWQPDGNGVTLGAARVTRGARHFVQANSAMGTSGSPFLYWDPHAQEGLFVTGNPTPSAAILTVFGFAVPKPLSGDTDTFPAAWLKAEDAYTVALYMAARVSEKRAADALLGPRQGALWAAYESRREAHRARLTDAERAVLIAFDDGAGG